MLISVHPEALQKDLLVANHQARILRCTQNDKTKGRLMSAYIGFQNIVIRDLAAFAHPFSEFQFALISGAGPRSGGEGCFGSQVVIVSVSRPSTHGRCSSL